MTRIQNILVGIDLHHGDRIASADLSEESRAAAAEALRLAAFWGATLTFCSVLELSAQSQSLIEHDHENVFETVEDFANVILSRFVGMANAQGIAAESVLKFGAAWEELSREAATGEYDLVIIGTRARVRATRILFGSTAQKLMRFAPCPVWVVKPGELREVRDVAVATDLSAAALPALMVAVTVARAIGARLHVVHAIELADLRYLTIAGMGEAEIAETEARIRQTAEDQLRDQLHQTDFRTLPHGVKIELLSGEADSVIPEFVAANGIDLLVMGTNGRSGLSGFMLGNTAERILPALQGSLLTVKPAGFRSPYSK
jgi:universal stress protein E